MAGPRFVYYNFLTDSEIPESVLTAVRTTVEPPEGSVSFNDSQLAAFIPTPWPGPWAVLNLVGAEPQVRREADFLLGIGYGADMTDSSGTKMLIQTTVAKELYGPAVSLFQFPAEGGVPTTVPVEKITAMAAFLEQRVVPLYAARTARQLEGLPSTVRAGVDLRRDLREMEQLVRDLRIRVGNPTPSVGKSP